MKLMIRLYKGFRRRIGLPLFEPFFLRDDGTRSLLFVADWGKEFFIRFLKEEEHDLPIWVILGISEKEYYKDPSLGCSWFEAIKRYE